VLPSRTGQGTQAASRGHACSPGNATFTSGQTVTFVCASDTQVKLTGDLRWPSGDDGRTRSRWALPKVLENLLACLPVALDPSAGCGRAAKLTISLILSKIINVMKGVVSHDLLSSRVASE
jgi:hypothetical protein